MLNRKVGLWGRVTFFYRSEGRVTLHRDEPIVFHVYTGLNMRDKLEPSKQA